MCGAILLTPPIVFMAWYLVKDKDTFTLHDRSNGLGWFTKYVQRFCRRALWKDVSWEQRIK